jgi:hypothetical protein
MLQTVYVTLDQCAREPLSEPPVNTVAPVREIAEWEKHRTSQRGRIGSAAKNCSVNAIASVREVTHTGKLAYGIHWARSDHRIPIPLCDLRDLCAMLSSLGAILALNGRSSLGTF